jgi:hypothetical protein
MVIRSQDRGHCGVITILYAEPPLIQIPEDVGDGNGGYVCFICNKTMDKGESFACVDRLLETYERGEVKPSVTDAVASLQVCLPCTLLSGYQRLEWATKPKLTRLEIWGFHTYARMLGETVSRNRCDTRVQPELLKRFVMDTSYLSIELDRIALLGGTREASGISMISKGHCPACHGTIDFAKPHLVFEIAIDTPWRDAMKKSNIWHLGEYCYECSKQFLPLYSRLW